jgi:hypothetical protein
MAKWLRTGQKGSLRRKIVAWCLNRFRQNSVRFYSVQNPQDVERLLAGGEPWPSGLRRANIGQGLYAWATRVQANRYLQRLDPDSELRLRIMTHRVLKSEIQRFFTLDMRNWDDDAIDAWMNLHSHYGRGVPHNYQYVIRVTGNFGAEHLFTPAVFRKYFVTTLRSDL